MLNQIPNHQNVYLKKSNSCSRDLSEPGTNLHGQIALPIADLWKLPPGIRNWFWKVIYVIFNVQENPIFKWFNTILKRGSFKCWKTEPFSKILMIKPIKLPHNFKGVIFVCVFTTVPPVNHVHNDLVAQLWLLLATSWSPLWTTLPPAAEKCMAAGAHLNNAKKTLVV